MAALPATVVAAELFGSGSGQRLLTGGVVADPSSLCVVTGEADGGEEVVVNGVRGSDRVERYDAGDVDVGVGDVALPASSLGG